MKRIPLFFAIVSASFLSPKAPEPPVKSVGPSIHLEIGGGSWLGEFAGHLNRDGAFLGTPEIAFTLRIPVWSVIGVEGIFASACVIHPLSQPIEGTFFYQGLGPSVAFPVSRARLSLSAVVGFQHATLLLAPYSSGFFQAALGCSVPLGERLLWIATIRCRTSFLNAVTIPALFGLSAIDAPTSLTITTGVGVRW